jgi:hypothetical protein
MADQFREVEETFQALREKFNDHKISQREFIDTLKSLRIKDPDGRFWMIGAQTGKWYYFEGNDWVQAEPPTLKDRKAICIYCGYENDLEAEVCLRCGNEKPDEAAAAVCPGCGTKLARPGDPCLVCSTREIEARAGSMAPRTTPGAGAAVFAPGQALVIRSFHLASFFWFFAIMGLFAGMIFGLVVGVTSLFPGIAAGLPAFFVDIQGKLVGGIVYTVVGGVLGFVMLGGGGLLAVWASNGILSFVGGLRVSLWGGEGSGERRRP